MVPPGTALRAPAFAVAQSVQVRVFSPAHTGVAILAGVLGHTAAEAAAVEVEVTAIDAELVAASTPPSIQPISSRPTTRPVAGCADSRWLVRWQSCVVILIACRGGRSMEETMPTDSGVAFRVLCVACPPCD